MSLRPGALLGIALVGALAAAVLVVFLVRGDQDPEVKPDGAEEPAPSAAAGMGGLPASPVVPPEPTPTAPPADETPAPAPEPTPEPTPKPKKSTPAASGDAAALQLQGNRLVAAGDYAAAIPVLQRARDATGRSTEECLNPTGSCLTYAYALYDLGRALRLAGRPAEAVPVLEERLRIANQREVVQRELEAARAAAS